MTERELVDKATYPIQPKDIDVEGNSTDNRIYGVFGSSSLEHNARVLLTFFQEQGTWEPFTDHDFERRFQYRMPDPRHLVYHDSPLVTKLPDGRYAVTHEFISRIFVKYPAVKAIDEVPAPT